MLLFAFHAMSARVERRLRAAMDAWRQPPTTRALLRALLVAMVPSDADSRFEAPLWVAFLARAVVEPSLAGPLHDAGKALADFAAERLRSAQDAGEVAASLDPEREAASLFALADGLMIHTLLPRRGRCRTGDPRLPPRPHLRRRKFRRPRRGSRSQPDLSGCSIVVPELVGKDDALWWSSSAVVGERFVALARLGPTPRWRRLVRLCSCTPICMATTRYGITANSDWWPTSRPSAPPSRSTTCVPFPERVRASSC